MKTSSPGDSKAALESIGRMRNFITLYGGFTPEVIQKLRDLHVSNPDLRAVRDLLLRGLVQMHDWDGIIEFIDETPPEQRTPADNIAYATALCWKQQYEEAGRLIDPIADAQPDKSDVLHVAIICAFHTERQDRAAFLLDQHWDALLKADLYDVNYYRGALYVEDAQYDRAEKLLSTLVDLVPTYAPAYDELARVYTARGDSARAKQARETAASIRSKQLGSEALELHLAVMATSLQKAWAEHDYARCERYAAELLPHAALQDQIVLFDIQARAFGAQSKTYLAEDANRKLDAARREAQFAESKQQSPSGTDDNDFPGAPPAGGSSSP